MFQVSSFKFQDKRGFTLIEILIVVAIIGLLSSVVLVGLGSFRARGRDARRIADIRGVQNSLELYYIKGTNNSYPPSSSWNVLQSTLINAGIGVVSVPNDPQSASGKTYYYGSSGQGYVIGANLEDANNPALTDDIDGTVNGVDCADTAPNSLRYCVQF